LRLKRIVIKPPYLEFGKRDGTSDSGVSPKRRESGGLYTWLFPFTSGVASTFAKPSGSGLLCECMNKELTLYQFAWISDHNPQTICTIDIGIEATIFVEADQSSRLKDVSTEGSQYYTTV
jgi:hypothetical protein